MVECLSSKHEALSNSNTAQKKAKEILNFQNSFLSLSLSLSLCLSLSLSLSLTHTHTHTHTHGDTHTPTYVGVGEREDGGGGREGEEKKYLEHFTENRILLNLKELFYLSIVMA
jgi:hypothetical protein